MASLVVTNARIVTDTAIVNGGLHVDAGVIQAIDGDGPSPLSAVDFEGDFLLPGLVELHTDNVEKHLVPRASVRWPHPLAAMIAHDNQVVGAGITTVLDAMAVGEYRRGGERREIIAEAVAALRRGKAEDLFRADHHLHLRCEVSDAAVVEMAEPYVDDPLLRLFSVMDHTPGQRQFQDLERFRRYRVGTGVAALDVDREIEELRAAQSDFAHRHRHIVLGWARERGLPVASHDDTTEAHIAEAVADGIAISEFPTTRVAARLARDAGIKVVMGGPNVVRGGSHSGNIAAMSLAEDGLLDALSSDYAPKSLLHAAFLVANDAGLALPDAIALVTRNPAGMLGLDDRGVIAAGKRADLLRVRLVDGLPIVRTVWVEGERVL
ncbi:MAG: alpha-D-ribose 1-methylphosphonate 5-triphosphate diphosphatase [Pseudomonadota bacterium]